MKSVKEKAMEEINEELGIGEDSVANIKVGDYYEFSDKEINKTWITNPVSIELKEKPEIKLDWEHSEYRWIKKEDLSQFDTISNLSETLERVLAL